MSRTLFTCRGGHLLLPDAASVLLDRRDGGNLLVVPPRKVWERSELDADELTHWSFLVAASGRAMIETLPQLAGGCINYWEAGNWALNDQAQPVGRKLASEHRSMHLHLLGRSPSSTDPAWRWGESPRFPEYAERLSWSGNYSRLNADECHAMVQRVEVILSSRYGVGGENVTPWSLCYQCRYPTANRDTTGATLCLECDPA